MGIHSPWELPRLIPLPLRPHCLFLSILLAPTPPLPFLILSHFTIPSRVKLKTLVWVVAIAIPTLPLLCSLCMPAERLLPSLFILLTST
ncbi:hypothetical protein F4804DRAFT_135604 [Jackrogersella minutella]|nr:hypothetical protein F4804DRAFT_135604 [Jackrogersella minutella]